jgi:universal stress protein A
LALRSPWPKPCKEDVMTLASATGPSRIIVVVGVDLTNVSAHLLEQTAALVRTIDQPEIHVVHVVKPEPPLLRVVRPADAKDAGAVYRVEKAQEVIERLCEHLREIPHARVVMHTPVGDPAVQLARIADEVAADILVVEAHAQHGHARAFHRSLVNQVTGIAPCTVIAIRTKPSMPARYGVA